MQIASTLPRQRKYRRCSTVIFTLALSAWPLFAQSHPSPPTPYNPADNVLPNAPTPAVAPTEDTLTSISVHRPRPASRTQKYIEQGQYAPPLTARGKVILGVYNEFTPMAFAGWITVAGYSQLVNSSPNYGTDRGACGQRLYASAIRGATEGGFSSAIMAPLFHQDPRYYKLGHGYSYPRRTLYAASRAFVTRTDDGHNTFNSSLWAGHLAGAALTNAYYPSQNRSVQQTFETFGGSIGGAALGFIINEYLTGALHHLHLKQDE